MSDNINIQSQSTDPPAEPLTREEQYLSAIAGVTPSSDIPEKPLTRIEKYLNKIVENGGGGSGFEPTDEQLAAMNSGITSEDVKQIGTNKNNILSVDRTKATYTITSDNLFKPTYSNDNGVTIEYKNGVTKITGTPISNGWRNVGTVYLPVGTYHINSGQISTKPTIYVRQGTTNIGLLRGTERVGSAFTITEEGIYTVDAYLAKTDTYNFDNYLQVGTTSADVLDEYHTAFDNSFKKPFGSVKYEAIGDSLTYGFIGFDGGQQVRLDNPYPERVAQIIGTNYVYNKGQTGTTVANDTTVMESYYPMSNDTRLATYVNADVISIMGGTNDYIKATAMGTLGTADDTTFYGGLQKIINYLRTNNPTAFVFVIIPTITSGYSTANSAGNTFKDYKNAMIDVCEAYGVPYIDMSVYGELTNGYTSQWTVDGTHYNQNYTDKIFAPLIADFISRHYNRNTKY